MAAENVLCILEKLGYSKDLAEKRVAIYKNASKGSALYENKKFGVDYDVVIVGSRGDGTGVYLDCDVDKLLVQNNIRCFEKECNVNMTDNETTFFELDTDNVPNGYTKLKFISKAENHFDRIHTNIVDALEDINGTRYLRNDHRLSPAIGQPYKGDNWGWIEKHLKHAETKSGPSNPYRLKVPFLPNYILLEDVLAFRCECLSATDDWCKRERKHNWPSEALTDKVKHLDAFVVPVGVKGSKNEHLQWRVCFTMAELALVQSFNDLQIKLFGALKMIAKHYLAPICDNITSYIIKTILFWQIEQTNSGEWKAENFERRLSDALRYLHTCILNEQLPNYMIPSRNMLHNKISAPAKNDLLEIIDFFIKNNPTVFIRYIVLHNLTEVENSEQENVIYSRTVEETSSSGSSSLSPKQICEQDLQKIKYLEEKESASQVIMQRHVREQFVLSMFSLPPEDIAAILKEVFEAKEQVQVISAISKKVFPYVKQHNPYGLFPYIVSMDEPSIYAICGSDKLKCVIV